MLPTLRRAVQAMLDAPGRRGHFVSLDGAGEIFATGDLHGNLDNFRKIFRAADLANHPRRHLVLQELIHPTAAAFSGIDRSHQLLDLLAALTCQFPGRVHFLPGNHELAQRTGKPIFKGDADLNDFFVQGVRADYGDSADQIYATYLEMFAAAPLALRTANRIFLSHSLPSSKRLEALDLAVLLREDYTDEELTYPGPVYSLVWGRDTRPETAAEFLRKVDADLLITGHIACDEGFAVPNDRQLILDSLGERACSCLFPVDRPLSHEGLLACVRFL
jgi:hypothetical protein